MDEETRQIMAANLVDFLLALEAKAELDSDPVSIKGLVDGGEVVGAVVLVRGADVCAEFMAWAVGRGHLTEGKGIEDGTDSEMPDA